MDFLPAGKLQQSCHPQQDVWLRNSDRAWRLKKPRDLSSKTTSTMSYSGALMPADSSQSSAHTAGGGRSTYGARKILTDRPFGGATVTS